MDFELFAKQAAREELIKFCIVYDKDYTVNWHHSIIASALERVERGEIKRLIIQMPPRHGKQIANSTPILTTKGWKTHGELKVGDYVFGSDGKPVKIIGTSKESLSDREVIFADGTRIVAHAKHEWSVYDRKKRKTVILETEELEKLGVWNKEKKGERARFFVNYTTLYFKKKDVPLDPYFLGIWIGDGYTGKPSLALNPNDYEEIIGNFPFNFTNIFWHKTTGVPTITYYKTNVLNNLRKLGILKSKDIPDLYLYNSEKIRRELLAGLIDSDGHIDSTGRVRFINTNKKIIDKFIILVSSLGYRVSLSSVAPTKSSSGIIGRKRVYYVSFSPFDCKFISKLKRKKIKRFPVKRNRSIISIKKCKPEMSKCIQVENSDGIYLVTDRFIPTHNSQLASIYFPSWYLGRHPEKEIILCSYSSELASDFGFKTRNVINDSQYKSIFKTRLRDDSQSKNKWLTNEGGGYISVGVGGSITGRGADLLLIDDPVKNREEAESLIVRKKIRDWFTSTAYTRLEKDAAIVIIMTRWHKQDLVGEILEESNEDWEVLNFPAIAEEDEKYRKKGEALWPEKYSIDNLETTKNVIGIYDWSSLYQQQPIAQEAQEFKKENFKYFSDAELDVKNVLFYTMVDLAGSKEKADDNAIITIAKERDRPDIYIVDILANIMNPGDVVNYLFMLKSKYGHRHVRFGIEAVGYQQTLKYWIQEEQRKRNVYFEITELKAHSQKEERIRGLKAMYSAGVIWHKNIEQLKETNKLEEQLLTFPQGKHDDVIDALAYCQQVLTNTTYEARKVYKPMWSGYKIK